MQRLVNDIAIVNVERS